MMNKERRQALSLIEILICSILLLVVLGGLITMVTSGKKTTEHEVKYLQALHLAEFIARDLERLGTSGLQNIQSVSEPQAFVEGSGAPVSSLGKRYLSQSEALFEKFPKLKGQMENYRLSYAIEPMDGVERARKVAISVHFRISPAAQHWYKVKLHTIIVEKSPL